MNGIFSTIAKWQKCPQLLVIESRRKLLRIKDEQSEAQIADSGIILIGFPQGHQEQRVLQVSF